MAAQRIRCSVNNCHYWSEGNVCRAEEITVTSSEAAGNTRDGRAQFEMAAEISPTPVANSMATCCKTFVEKGDKAKADGIKKI